MASKPFSAFSGKQKKEQLQAKRQAKREAESAASCTNRGQARDVPDDDAPIVIIGGGSSFKYGEDKMGIRSQFQRESPAALEARKRLAFQPLEARDFTPGVPFGEYFTMLGVRRENLEEQHFSRTFPLTVALPTRTQFVDPSFAQEEEEEEGIMGEEGGSGGSNPKAGVSSSTSSAKPINATVTHDDDNEAEADDVGEDEDTESARHAHAQRQGRGRGRSQHGTRGKLPGPRNAMEQAEDALFRKWMDRVDNMQLPDEYRGLESNTYERNLDVWRQLWRTVEQSDVVVVVADCRYPIVHLPISLLHYIMVLNKKPVVVCLNKGDLVPPSVVEEWKIFLANYFVSMGVSKSVTDVPLVTFTSMPEAETALASESQQTDKRRTAKHRNQKQYEELKAGKKTNSLEAELGELGHNGSDDDEDEDDTYAANVNFKGMKKAEKNLQQGKRDHKELAQVSAMIQTLLSTCKTVAATHNNNTAVPTTGSELPMTTIGIVGHPNVGKSSLLNALRGTKVVSVSATAGHTKHLQTIPLPEERITLVDCPGLAFPVFGLPRPMQAVIGTHQVAQTRDPQSGVAYLAARLPLEKIYALRRVDNDEREPWSAFDVCESYSTKKGFMIKHGRGIADVHRGAIAILQEAYEGRLVLYFRPPPTSWLTSEAFVSKTKPWLLLKPLPLIEK